MPRPRLSRRIIFFSEFEADLQSGELRKHGLKIPLQEKPFQLLAILLERPGEMVSREELRQKLWPPGTHVDFDHSLNIAISKLRHALSEPAEKQGVIERVGSRGYRFMAPTTMRKIHGKVTPIKGNEKNRVRIRLAVLPFESLSAMSEQTYLNDGMTEEIITQLGHLYPGYLGVIARTSTAKYRARASTTEEIARELKVDYILDGTVRCASDRMRITAQLVQVNSQTNLWSETYEHRLGDILAGQIEVAGKIARSVGLELYPSQKIVITPRSPSNPEAYLAYLKGRYHQSKRTEEGLKKSIEYFERAIREDSDYALAYCALAESNMRLGSAGYGGGHPGDFFPTAMEAALKALEINDTLAEGHLSLAQVKFLYEWDWQGAEKLFRRAIELNPSLAAAHRMYSYYLTSRGRHKEAVAESQQTHEFDPLELRTSIAAGATLYHARRYDEAVEELLKTLDLEPNFGPALMLLGIAYGQNTMFAEAIATLEKARVYDPNNPAAIAWLGNVYAMSGGTKEAQQLLDELKRLSGERYVPAFDFALIHVGLGERDEALKSLEKAYEERSPFMALLLRVDPRFDSLRSDRRFQDLVKRVGC